MSRASDLENQGVFFIMKKCTKCKTEKPITEFHKHKGSKDGLYPSCKICYKQHYKQYYAKNKENYRKRGKIYREKNPIKFKQYRDQYDKEFQSKTNYRKKYLKYRWETDPEYKLTHLLRCRFYDAIKNKRKYSSILDLLGCSIKEYKLYLEKMFLEPMSWENYGDIWEIDHIKPCASFNLLNIEDQKQCFHYTNTQPLFKTTAIAESFGYKDIIGNKNKSKKQ